MPLGRLEVKQLSGGDSQKTKASLLLSLLWIIYDGSDCTVCRKVHYSQRSHKSPDCHVPIVFEPVVVGQNLLEEDLWNRNIVVWF